MDEHGFDEGLPIRCIRNGNGKLKITHGHHRFHVARKKGLPVWYIVANNDIPLFESEASAHSWDVRDFTVAQQYILHFLSHGCFSVYQHLPLTGRSTP